MTISRIKTSCGGLAFKRHKASAPLLVTVTSWPASCKRLATAPSSSRSSSTNSTRAMSGAFERAQPGDFGFQIRVPCLKATPVDVRRGQSTFETADLRVVFCLRLGLAGLAFGQPCFKDPGIALVALDD